MRIMWFPLAMHLVSHLKTIPGFDDTFNIGIDGIGDDINKPTKIEILWDSESGISPHVPSTSKVVLYIDINYRTDSIDASDAYKGQYEIQQAILTSMGLWHDEILRDLKIATLITVPGIAASGKIIAPTYLNRVVIMIEWKDKGR